MTDELEVQSNPEPADSVPAPPENFKTWEAVEESRREAQATLTRVQQEAAQLRAENEQYAQLVAQQQQPEQPDWQEQWAERTGLDAETIRAVAMISDQVTQHRFSEYQKQNSPTVAQNADTQNHLVAYTADQIVRQRVLSEYGDDWDAVRGKVAEAIQQEPDLFPESAVANPELTARALERVYKMVKADEVLEQIQSGQPVDQGRQSKLNAQTMSGAAGRPGEASDDEEWYARLKAAANSESYSARMGGTGL